MKKMIWIFAVALMSASAFAAGPASDDTQIRCTVDGQDGSHLAGESSTLARGVDLTGERGVDFFAYIDGRTDRRVFRVDAYDTHSQDLLASKSVSYYASTTAKLSLALNGLIFNCEMDR